MPRLTKKNRSVDIYIKNHVRDACTGNNEGALSMRKLLNTLYVTNPDSYLVKDGDNVVVRVDNTERFRIPVYNLEGIVCFGYMGGQVRS